MPSHKSKSPYYFYYNPNFIFALILITYTTPYCALFSLKMSLQKYISTKNVTDLAN